MTATTRGWVCLVAMVCAACGSSADGGGATSSQADGTWHGTWLSRTGVGGSATLQLSDQGGSLAGDISFTNSPCFASGSIAATLDGQAFSATVTAGAIDVAITGTMTGNQLSGSYDAISAGACTGDTGTFTATR